MRAASLLTPVTGTLHALQVPIPYPMRTVTVLIDAPRRGPVTLIDTALDTPEAQQVLEDGLGALGLHWPDVDRVIVTHHHPDHYGLTGLIEERSGARVQALDVEVGSGVRYWQTWEAELPAHLQHLLDHGLPPEQRPEMEAEFRRSRARVTLPARVEALHEGEHLSLAGGEWEVRWLPGHADGHLGLWQPQERLLVAGDAVLPRITPNIGVYAFSRPDPLGDYLRTLEQVETLNPVRAVVGHHGPLMENVAERCRELRAHHGERLSFIQTLLRRSELSAYDLSRAMFRRELDSSGRRFALAEALAHAEHLRHLGTVQRTWAQDRGMWLYHS